ncbi:MAG: hypothetical protein EOP36_19695 [Rubrivivax sp.]|nr:MAG: hypothetical protein EOP36_19695 [Rubrivivax sp.]
MFSQYLFTHKYDIDDIIAALCAPTPSWLNTQSGALTAEEPTDAPASHRFRIEHLPASYLNEISTSSDKLHLSEDDLATITHILATNTLQQLPQHFAQGRAGGWLRERVKDAALEWLDVHDLIPPSMRHINRAKAAKLYASKTVTIEDLD